MRRLRNKTLNEFYDRSNKRIKQNSRKTNLLSLIPTFLLTIYILTIPANWNESHLILLPFAIISIYLFSLIGALFVCDCWTIAEMASPPILGEYRKTRNFARRFRIFFNLLVDTPTRQEFLRATKLYNDVVEKNGFENYLSASEFTKKFYDRQEQQDKAIKERDEEITTLKTTVNKLEKIIEDILKDKRQDRIKDLAIYKEQQLRKEAERKQDEATYEATDAKIKLSKVSRLIEQMSNTIINLKNEIKRLKGE